MEKPGIQGKELVLSILGVLLLIGVVVGVSYAVFSWDSKDNTENTLKTGSISFAYNDSTNTISITNAQPMTDEAGKLLTSSNIDEGIMQGYFDFSVTGTIIGSTTVSYEVYGVLESDSDMDPQFIKVYLTDGGATDKAITGYDGEKVPVYASLPQATSNAAGKRLYLGTFTSGQALSQNFRLRLWVADTYTEASSSKTFLMKVSVKATA